MLWPFLLKKDLSSLVISDIVPRESLPIGVIPDIVCPESIPIGVMPDIGNRASILGFFRMDPRLLLAGMTEGEMDPRLLLAGMTELGCHARHCVSGIHLGFVSGEWILVTKWRG